MAKEYSWEIRERAEELYVVDGLTFEQTAEATEVSVSQLKRWAKEAKPPWGESRREYRQALSSIRRNTVLAKSKLIKDVVTSMDPQKAYAFTSLYRATAAIAQSQSVTSRDGLMPRAQDAQERRSIKTPQEAIDALQDAIENKINTMLTQPGELSLKSIKEMKQAMEMVDTMQAKYKADTEDQNKAGGITEETAEAIRRQVLGLKK